MARQRDRVKPSRDFFCERCESAAPYGPPHFGHGGKDMLIEEEADRQDNVDVLRAFSQACREDLRA